MSDIIAGAAAGAAGAVVDGWLGGRTHGLRFECSLRVLDSRLPPVKGLSHRWRTGAAEFDGHLMTFAANWISGFRVPRRRPIQFEVTAVHFDRTRDLTLWESWYLALAADTAVELSTRSGQRIEWALPSQRLESVERRSRRATPPA
ncbi:hypothetical protein [Intrasporangium mesophilum]